MYALNFRANPALAGIMAEAYGGTERSYALTGQRAANPIIAAQGVDYLLTEFLLRTGPMTGVDVGTQLFPVVNVPMYRVKIGILGNVALFPGQIHRPAGAEYTTTRPLVNGQVVELERYGRAGWIDRDELGPNLSNFPALSLVAAGQARSETLRGLDQTKAALAANNASYGVVSTGGSWTVDGSMLDQITYIANAIGAVTGVSMADLTVAFLNNTLTTAKNDALFLERRKFSNGANAPTLEDIRAYLGVKSCLHINSTGLVAEGATVQFVFGNDVLVYYQGDPIETATAPPEYGIRCWGRTIRIPGAASESFFENKTTKWYFPYDIREYVKVIDPGCAGRITNPQ